jgi:hypothetical protein
VKHAIPYTCLLYGTLFVQALWGGPLRRALGLKLALGLLCGLGLASLWATAALALGLGLGRGVLVLGDGMLIMACAGAALWRRARARPGAFESSEPGAERAPSVLKALGLLFALALGCALFTSVQTGRSNPFGHWDAAASWNLKARCLALDAPGWRRYVSNNQVVAGADYPLLVPSLVARGYVLAGEVTELTAAVLGPLFSYASLALLVFGLARLAGRAHGLLAGLFWLGTPRYFQFGAAQYGDAPVAAYFVGTLIVLALSDAQRERRGELVLLAGFLAGLGASAKHEGQMLFILTALVRAVGVASSRGVRAVLRESALFAAGGLPGVAAVLVVRSASDATGYFAQNEGAHGMLAKLVDPARHAEIGRAFVHALTMESSLGFTALLGGALLLALMLGFGRREREERLRAAQPLATVLLGILGYAAIFAMTPMDLAEHLATTAHRFFVQVFPALIFAFFSLVAPLEGHARPLHVPQGTP